MKHAALVLLASSFWLGCSHKQRELQIYCWADYIAPEVLQSFAKESGCTVAVRKCESSQDLLQKLQDKGECDLCFVSDDAVGLFVEKGLLEKLDPSKLPNKKHLAPKFQNLSFDPGNAYTVPYFWGTTGIAFNKDKVSPPPTSWKDLWNEKYKDRVSLVDDPREAIGAALRAEGMSANDLAPDSLAKAKERLMAHRAYAKKPESAPKDKLISGDLWICQCFSGDAVQARQASRAPPIHFIVPVEGGSIWMDSMAIPKGARNADLAHAFIDFVLRPDNAAALANHMGYASPNQDATPSIDPELLKDPVANPPEDMVKRCEHLKPPSPDEKRRLETLWSEFTSK